MTLASASEQSVFKSADKPRFEPVLQSRAMRVVIAVLLIALLALGLRIGWLQKHTGIIEHEGAYYARLGENLATGVGWIGLHFEGEQFFYSPGYPLLIAPVRLIVRDAEFAGRLVSLAFGSALVVAVFLLASDLYDRRVGYLAAALVALHPVLVGMSTTVNSEPTYFCLLFAGVFFVRRAVTSRRRWCAVVSGILLGLGYLTRAEALLIATIGIFWVLISGWKKQRLASAQLAGLLLAAFAFVASPYVLYLAKSTGQFHLEAKSASNFAYGQMILSGKSSSEANFGIDPDLTPRGLDMRTSLEVLRTTKVKPTSVVRFLLGGIRRNGKALIGGLLTNKAIGGVPLMALVALGLFGTAWNANRAANEVFLFALFVCLVVPLFSLIFFDDRYLVVFLIPLIIWAAKGLTELSNWSGETARTLGLNQGLIASTQAVIVLFATATLFALTWQGVKEFAPLVSEDAALRLVGQEMKDRFPPRPRILDTGPYIAFYSGGTYGPFPFCDEETALKFIRTQNVDFLILRQNRGADLSYYNKWEREGIPDPKAHLILQTETRNHERISVYRWAG